MNKLCSIVVLGVCLSGCNDYPGTWPNEVKMQSKPSWGDTIDQEIAVGGDCNIDSINDEPGDSSLSHTVKQSGTVLRVSGWAAISVKAGVIATETALALKNSTAQSARLFATTTRVRRPDVANYFKNPASVETGFKSALELSNVPPGEYILEVIQHKDGKNYKCPVTANIIVVK